MNTHIEQLEQWWNSADEASPQEGDTIIYRESRPDGTHYYGLEVVEEDFAGDSNTRILERAPKPKPAWHDAVAVMATHEGERMLFAQYGYGAGWFSENYEATPDELTDVTPLIEARVTDEMVDRAYRRFSSGHYGFRDQLREVLHAALGLENE